MDWWLFVFSYLTCEYSFCIFTASNNNNKTNSAKILSRFSSRQQWLLIFYHFRHFSSFRPTPFRLLLYWFLSITFPGPRPPAPCPQPLCKIHVSHWNVIYVSLCWRMCVCVRVCACGEKKISENEYEINKKADKFKKKIFSLLSPK